MRGLPPALTRDPVAFVAEAHPGSVVAIVGVPQSGARGARWGKSRTAKAVDASGAWPRRIVFEPHGRRDRLEAARGKPLHPWPGRLVSVGDVLRSPGILDSDPLDLVVVPDGARDEEERGRMFAAVARACWHTGDVTVVAEEAAIYARHAVELMNLIATGGGHAGLRLVLISQSFTRIPIDARRNVSHVVAFAQGETADLDALRKRCGRGFAAGVARLGLGARPLTWRVGDAH